MKYFLFILAISAAVITLMATTFQTQASTENLIIPYPKEFSKYNLVLGLINGRVMEDACYEEKVIGCKS